MSKFICTVCGFVYDGAGWEDVPEDWVCPLCGAAKSEFEAEAVSSDHSGKTVHKVLAETPSDLKELNSLEMSALCSNLAQGCEKQYKNEEAGLFRELADYFKIASPEPESPGFDKLLGLIEQDLQDGFPRANDRALAAEDRGALRALVWSEKVTKILRSLISRYDREGDAMTTNTDVYVCTICGFVYVGDVPPEMCPVCKVTNRKFEIIKGGDAA